MSGGVCKAGFHCSIVREQGSLSNSLHLGKRMSFANGGRRSSLDINQAFFSDLLCLLIQ